MGCRNCLLFDGFRCYRVVGVCLNWFLSVRLVAWLISFAVFDGLLHGLCVGFASSSLGCVGGLICVCSFVGLVACSTCYWSCYFL